MKVPNSSSFSSVRAFILQTFSASLLLSERVVDIQRPSRAWTFHPASRYLDSNPGRVSPDGWRCGLEPVAELLHALTPSPRKRR